MSSVKIGQVVEYVYLALKWKPKTSPERRTASSTIYVNIESGQCRNGAEINRDSLSAKVDSVSVADDHALEFFVQYAAQEIRLQA